MYRFNEILPVVFLFKSIGAYEDNHPRMMEFNLSIWDTWILYLLGCILQSKSFLIKAYKYHKIRTTFSSPTTTWSVLGKLHSFYNYLLFNLVNTSRENNKQSKHIELYTLDPIGQWAVSSYGWRTHAPFKKLSKLKINTLDVDFQFLM